jgi:hypothetical protein
MSLPTGTGITVHNEAIPTPATYFPAVSWARFDDYGTAAGWGTGSLNLLATLHANYRAAGWKIVQDVGRDWGANGRIVGHARDLLSLGTIDVLLLPNEPDQADATFYPGAIPYATYATWAQNIKGLACAGVPGVLVAGPQLSDWDPVSPTGTRTWGAGFKASGGLSAIDVWAQHFYTAQYYQPEMITTWASDLRSFLGSSMPIMGTEFGYQSAWVPIIKGAGAWSLADHAELTNRGLLAAQAAGIPFCLYDGAYSLNNDGLSPLVNTTVNGAANSTTQTLTTVANVVPGMFLAFGPDPVHATTIRQVTSVNAGAKTVLLAGAAVNTTNGWRVVNKDHNSALSFRANGLWDTDGVGLAPLGTALHNTYATI